ncbi:MAG: MFS transporter [Candidatus Tectomicrobia bacterium]|nr:MFS transporter [Candidatus Tectomicrobia bacterium]
MDAGAQRKLYYGWIILGVCAFTNLLILGVRFSSGIFLKPMSVELTWSRSLVSQGFALSNLLIGFYQPFTGRLLDRWGARPTMAAGALLTAVVTILISFTQAPWHFFATFGVLYPLGVAGSAIGSSAALVQRWFKRYRGTALSVVTAGASAGQFLVAPLFAFALIAYGWRATLFASGLLVLLVIVPILIIFVRERPEVLGQFPDGAVAASPRDAAPPSRSEPPGRTPVRAAIITPPSRECTLGEASTTLPFWLLCGGFFVCGWTVGMVSAHIAAYLDDLGFSKELGGYVLSVIGGMNIVGTLTMGGLSDRLGLKSVPLAVVYLIRGLALLMLVLSPSFASVMVFSFLIGFAWLATVPMTYGLIGDHFGLRNLGVISGFIYLAHQIGAGVSISLAGWWAEAYGSYRGMFLLAALLAFAATVCSYAIQEQRPAAAPAPRTQPAKA